MESKARCWYVLVLVLLLHVPTQGSDWPTYMHDRSRAGSTPDHLSKDLQSAWVFASASPPTLAWPGPGGKIVEGLKLEHRIRFDDVFHVAVVGQSVYFGTSVDNTVYCVDAGSGKPRWTYTTSGPIRLAPTVVDGLVYVGSDDGYVYCLNAQTGQPRWKLRAGPRDERILARGRMTSRWPVRTGVLVDQGVAYFGAGVFPNETVYLYAVDAATGSIIWKNDSVSQRESGRDELTPQGYLLATDELLFVPSGRTLPAAFDRQTGEPVHKQRGGGKQVGGSKALLAENHLYSIGSEQHILALDQQSGAINNRLRGRQMTLHDNMAYIADGKELIAIDRARFAEAKERRLELEAQLTQTQRSLLRVPAETQLRRVRALQQELEAGEAKLNQLKQDVEADTTVLATEKRKTDALRQQLVEAAGQYEESRKTYEELSQEIVQQQRLINEATRDGVRWRTELPHESSLMLTGNAVVAGGIGEVVAVDTQSGAVVWRQNVDGEVRGLAAASDRLFVSTTTGKVYCFAAKVGDGTTPVFNERKATSPYAHDGLTEMYATAAEQILATSGVRRGFCLIYGSEQGRLAYELAKRSELVLCCLESDSGKVDLSRSKLLATGLYGTRITIDHADLSLDPYPNYFANLIVSDTMLLKGEIPADAGDVVRHLKPEGGIICLGTRVDAAENSKSRAMAWAKNWLNGTELPEENALLGEQGHWFVARRGSLPGVAGWTHQYGNPGNTSSVEDMRVKGGVRVLWYGDPGPSKMLNRHQGAVGPVSAAGRLFVQGEESIMAYDAYNGLFLWERENPDALITGVFNNYEPGNLVATADSLFVVIKDRCLHLDAATGELRRALTVPKGDGDAEKYQWGYVAYRDGRLYGSVTVRKLIAEEARRRGQAAEADSTDGVFAVDPQTGELLWHHQGENISHTTIAIDGQRVYFIDSSITSEQREHLLRQDKSTLRRLSGEARRLAEERLKRIDVRRAVALNAESGQPLWDLPVDVTDCSGVGTGAGRLTLMVSDRYVVICGANANGHYWKQFLAGEFKRRRLVVLAADSGQKIWARDANYRHRPVIIGDRLVAEPWSYYLPTGEQEVRVHPLTGKQTPWKFIRPGHHCGAISATPSMMFFRSGFTAYYDLETDSGTHHFAGHRLGCWINTIPANGLVMIPEASAGCACLFSLTSTIVFEPHENRRIWGVYTAEGVTTPVQHMALNLGGPGDRRDAHGKLWLSYPRPASRTGLDLPLDIRPMSAFGAAGTYFQLNEESQQIVAGDPPWIYTSGMLGINRCELPLIGEGQPPANYTVRLYFAADKSDEPGQRVFDVRLQGTAVENDVDVVQAAGGAGKAYVLEKTSIPVSENLSIDLIPHGQSDRQRPFLNAIEVVRDGSKEIIERMARR